MVVNLAAKKTDIDNDMKSLFLYQIFIVIYHVYVFMDKEPIEPFIMHFEQYFMFDENYDANVH